MLKGLAKSYFRYIISDMVTDSIKDVGTSSKGQLVENKSWDFVRDKAHRLSSILYLVTNFMSDMEPLKWNLRDKAISLLTVVSAGDTERSLNVLKQLVSLIEMGLVSRTVSEMNFSFLRNEYELLRDRFPVGHDLLDMKFTPRSVAPAADHDAGPFLRARSDQSPRKESILAFLRNREGGFSIKDIVQAFPQWSNKTVQRELQQLARSGLIIKEGNRRWTRYRV